MNAISSIDAVAVVNQLPLKGGSIGTTIDAEGPSRRSDCAPEDKPHGLGSKGLRRLQPGRGRFC
jgi:hypothetical protein